MIRNRLYLDQNLPKIPKNQIDEPVASTGTPSPNSFQQGRQHITHLSSH